MKSILKWQYDHMVKELLLLQDHASDPSCPCATDGEMCVRKHLMTVEAYAEETVPMEEAQERVDLLQQLGDEAKKHRQREEDALCGEDVPADLTDWSREWRKRLEAVSLACDSPDENADEQKGQCDESCSTDAS